MSSSQEKESLSQPMGRKNSDCVQFCPFGLDLGLKVASLGFYFFSLKSEQRCPLLPPAFMEAILNYYEKIIFIFSLLILCVGSCLCLMYLESYPLPLAHVSFLFPAELLEIHQRFIIFSLHASSKHISTLIF